MSDVLDVYRLPESKWHDRGRRQLIIEAYWRSRVELAQRWPSDDADGYAKTMGVIAAHLGY